MLAMINPNRAARSIAGSAGRETVSKMMYNAIADGTRISALLYNLQSPVFLILLVEK
jgi:hypothetical protein